MNCPKCGTELEVVFAGQAAAAKTKRVSTMSEADRKAVGIRLQTARAAKMGLTLDQLRTLKIRPGQQPTAEQLAQVKGETAKAPKPVAVKSKPKK
jgi:hypothetical protein